MEKTDLSNYLHLLNILGTGLLVDGINASIQQLDGSDRNTFGFDDSCPDEEVFIPMRKPSRPLSSVSVYHVLINFHW